MHSTIVSKGNIRKIWDLDATPLDLTRKQRVASQLTALKTSESSCKAADIDLTQSYDRIVAQCKSLQFEYITVPLQKGYTADESKRHYLLRNGNGATTQDLRMADLICRHDLFVHPADGSFVRIKPDGIPGDPYNPSPQVCKGILISAMHSVFSTADASFDNEALKFSESNLPLPSTANNPAYGLRQPRRKNHDDGMPTLASIAFDSVANQVMKSVHLPLK